MPVNTPASPVPSWSRLDGVDLLRGLAILLVLMNHVNMQLLFAHVPYTRHLPPQLTWSLVWNGQQGVQIFFAVSGFLITATTLRRWPNLRQLSIRTFLGLRFARIAPLLLLLLSVLSGLHAARVPNFVIHPSQGGLPAALFAALTFHINLFEATRGYLPGSWDILWSLSVEECFYLGFPFLVRLCPRPLLLAALGTFVVLGPFGRTVLTHGNPVWQEYSYLGGMDAIALGSLTAFFLHRAPLSARFLRLSTTLGALGLLFTLGFSIQAVRLGLGRSGLSMTLVALSTCCLIASAATSAWRSPRILSPLRLLGRRSYEVYLTHMFVVLALFRVFGALGKPLPLTPVLFLAAMLGAAALGELTGCLYADPANRRLRALFHEDEAQLGAAVSDADERALSLLR